MQYFIFIFDFIDYICFLLEHRYSTDELTVLNGDNTMVNYIMSGVERFCGHCMESGEFLPLKFVMMNIKSGLWMCPKEEVSII